MSDDAKWFDLDNPRAETNAFIQWKGTDVCMDFRCDCGFDGHVDGFFAHAVECPKCKQRWEMPMMLYPRKSQRPADDKCFVVAKGDDE